MAEDLMARKRALFLREFDAGGGDGERDALGRFAKGNPGRRRGSRNRLTGRVVLALLEDFERHQDELLPRMRRWFLPEYLRLVGRLLPRERAADLDDDDEDFEPRTAEAIAAARTALERLKRGEGSLEELRAALAGGDISNTVEYGESAEN